MLNLLIQGFELNQLYEKIMSAGKEHGINAGHTSSIRRIEGGMLSYHADINSNNNPYEVGLERLVDLDKDNDFIGKLALTNIKKNGVKNKQIGLVIECDPLQNPNNEFWDIINNNKKIGKVTSAVYSPRLEKNIALAIIESKYAKVGSRIKIGINDAFINCEQVSLPFYDPKKSLAKQ